MRCILLVDSFRRQVGHLFCRLMALVMQEWQKIWPHRVDVSSFMVSMHIAHVKFTFVSIGRLLDAVASFFCYQKEYQINNNIWRSIWLELSKWLSFCRRVWKDSTVKIYSAKAERVQISKHGRQPKTCLIQTSNPHTQNLDWISTARGRTNTRVASYMVTRSTDKLFWWENNGWQQQTKFPNGTTNLTRQCIQTPKKSRTLETLYTIGPSMNTFTRE